MFIFKFQKYFLKNKFFYFQIILMYNFLKIKNIILIYF